MQEHCSSFRFISLKSASQLFILRFGPTTVLPLGARDQCWNWMTGANSDVPTRPSPSLQDLAHAAEMQDLGWT